MRENFLEANKLRNLGADARAYEILKDTIPEDDSECFEKVITYCNVGGIIEKNEYLKNYKWLSSEFELAAKCVERVATQKVSDIDLDGLEKAAIKTNSPDIIAIFLTIVNALNDKSKISGIIHKLSLTAQQGFGFFNATLAESFRLIENVDGALKSAHQVLSENPTNPRAYRILALCEHKLGRLDEGLIYAKNAFAISPDQPEIAATYIATLNVVADYFGAIATYNKLSDPLKDHNNILEVYAVALMKSSQTLKSLRIFELLFERKHITSNVIKGYLHLQTELKRSSKVNQFLEQCKEWVKNDYDTCVLLGYHFLNEGNIDLSYSYFRRTLELSAKNPVVDNRLTFPVIAPRIIHDYQNLMHLKNHGLANESVIAVLPILKKYKQRADKGENKFGINLEERIEIEHALADYHYVPDIPFDAPAIADNDYRRIEQNYLNGIPRLVIIDNFLTEEALTTLRKFCLNATIWKRTYGNGYLGSFMSTGFCSRVILKIADELKIAMPSVVGPHLLKQAWGFKYDQSLKGINLHADFARVNVNFWITPDDCNLDKESGGIVVYDKPAPESWSFHDYNAESEKMRQFLEAHGSKSVRVPYKENRAVLFDSTYFHATDEIKFKPGYENRRINCTLLYGQDLRGG